VIVQIGGAIEPLAALLTPEWLGVCVLIHMAIIMPSVVKALSTHLTEDTELTLVLLLLMHFHR